MLPRAIQLCTVSAPVYATVLSANACCTVASCCTVVAILCASVLCCHVLYSCPCCPVAATVYAMSGHMPYSCCNSIFQFSALRHAIQFSSRCTVTAILYTSVVCHTAAATAYATMLCVTTIVLPHAMQLLHVVQFQPQCCMLYSFCHCVCQCSGLSHVIQLLPLCMPQCYVLPPPLCMPCSVMCCRIL